MQRDIFELTSWNALLLNFSDCLDRRIFFRTYLRGIVETLAQHPFQIHIQITSERQHILISANIIKIVLFQNTSELRWINTRPIFSPLNSFVTVELFQLSFLQFVGCQNIFHSKILIICNSFLWLPIKNLVMNSRK